MATRKYAALIHAWADGAVIQFLHKEDMRWMDSVDNNPAWSDGTEYRIKPKTRTVKFRNFIFNGQVRVHTVGTAIPIPDAMEWIDKDWREVEVEL